jgi:integrase
MDEEFIRLLKTLNDCKNLTIKDINGKVAYTEKTFRNLVKNKMGEIKSDNLEEALKLLNTIYTQIFKNISTLDNYFTQDIRKVIHFRFPDIDGIQSKEYIFSKTLARLDPKVKEDLFKSQKIKANSKAEDVEEIELRYVIDKIKKNIKSNDPIRRAFALLLASGCRPIELFHLSNFEVIDNHWIKQDKVAKKRGIIVSVEKPIIYLTSSQFIIEVEKMRNDAKKRFPSFIRSKEITVMRNDEKFCKKDQLLLDSIFIAGNLIAREVFDDEEGMTLYTTKSLYGAASYYIYGTSPNRLGNSLTQARWGELIYGHSSLMHNYSHYRIINNNNSKNYLQLDRIKDIYELDTNVNQTEMETLAKNIATRATIRLFFKSLKNNS